MKRFYFFCIIFLSLFANEASMGAQVSARKSIDLSALCTPKVGYPHLTDSTSDQGAPLSVKVNATARCADVVKDLLLSVELWKVGTFQNHLVSSKVTWMALYDAPKKTLYNQKTWAGCESGALTFYFGKVRVSGFYKGRYFKSPWVENDIKTELCCGTSTKLLS